MSAESIQWRETEPDVSVQDLDRLLRQTNWSNAVAFIENALAGLTVYFAKHCEQAIESHLQSQPYKLGGLLLGRVFKARFISSVEYPVDYARRKIHSEPGVSQFFGLFANGN